MIPFEMLFDALYCATIMIFELHSDKYISFIFCLFH